jgi:hypothetical protein
VPGSWRTGESRRGRESTPGAGSRPRFARQVRRHGPQRVDPSELEPHASAS